MAIQVQGFNGVVADVEGTVHRAQKMVMRPHDHGALGSYRASMQTGIMAAGLAAGSEVLQFRWTHATNLCVIEKVTFEGLGSIAAFAAGVVQMRLGTARAWSASGSGGTAPVMTGNNAKMRTGNMASSLVGDMRIATTAALGVGTKTIDTVDMGSTIMGVTAVAGQGVAPDVLFNPLPGMEHPIVLGTNEGIIVRATVPATGTWTAGFTISWTEMVAY